MPLAVIAVVAVVAVVAAVCRCPQGRADGVRSVVLFSFESAAELQAWDLRQADAQLSPLHVTDGRSSLEVTFAGSGRGWPGIYLVQGRKWSGGNWSGYQVLEMDVFNPGTQQVELIVSLFDTPDRSGGRFKRRVAVPPMRTTALAFKLGAGAGRTPGLDLSHIGEVALFLERPMRETTLFFDRIALSAVELRAPDLSVAPRAFSPNGDGWQDEVVARADLAEGLRWEVTISGDQGQMRKFVGRGSLDLRWDGRDEGGEVVPLGRYELALRVTDPDAGTELPRCISHVEVTDEEPPAYLVWSPPVSEKVRRDSPTGEQIGPEGLKVAGARNEKVAFQLVLSPTANPLKNAAIEVEDFVAAGGDTISADAVEVYRQAYIQVKQPSHRDWEPGLWWPDPLPLWEPRDVSLEDRHQPLWIEIAVPEDASAGEYDGAVTVKPEGTDETRVPVTLTVWDFVLPAERSLRTLFRLNMPSVLGQHLLPSLIEEGEAHEGTHAIKLSGEQTTDAVIYQMLRPGLQPDAEYVAGAWVKCDQDRLRGAMLQVKIIYKDKSLRTDVWERRFPSAAHDWKQQEISFRPKGQERFILVRLEAGEGGTVWLDEFYLKQTGLDNLIENGGFETGQPGRWQLSAENLPGVQELHERYFWFLVEHGVCPDLPVGFEDIAVQEYALRQSINSVRLPYRASWQLGDFPPQHEQELTQAVAAAREGGWLDKAFVYAVDEPSPQQYERVREVSTWVKQIDPEVKFLVTEQFEPELRGAIDLWCPVLARVDTRRLPQYQRQGETFWWYTCANPTAPHPTFLVDDYGVAPRILPWMNARFNVDGLLYWQTTQWRAVSDPWRDPLTLPWGNNPVNGDGSLLYPGTEVGFDGPVASLRLKLIREGLEDYEYLNLLRTLINNKAGAQPQPDASDPGGRRVAELCKPLFTTLTDYAPDAALLEQVRAEVAEEIVGLLQNTAGVQ